MCGNIDTTNKKVENRGNEMTKWHGVNSSLLLVLTFCGIFVCGKGTRGGIVFVSNSHRGI